MDLSNLVLLTNNLTSYLTMFVLSITRHLKSVVKLDCKQILRNLKVIQLVKVVPLRTF
jgi:hypothetical protein